jgi:hypothetical protein
MHKYNYTYIPVFWLILIEHGILPYIIFINLPFNHIKPNGNYVYVPDPLAISKPAFYIYEFCMIFSAKSDDFLKQR